MIVYDHQSLHHIRSNIFIFNTDLLQKNKKNNKCIADRHPLPRILMFNIQLMDNKLDKLLYPIYSQREVRYCNVLCFTETWLSPKIHDSTVELQGYTLHHLDRMAEATDKAKRRGVLKHMINKLELEHDLVHLPSEKITKHVSIQNINTNNESLFHTGILVFMIILILHVIRLGKKVNL